jgi:hypothetical protein
MPLSLLDVADVETNAGIKPEVANSEVVRTSVADLVSVVVDSRQPEATATLLAQAEVAAGLARRKTRPSGCTSSSI